MRLSRIALAVALASAAVAQAAPAKPRLVVVISIDQFRADLMRRFEPWFLPAKSNKGIGGFEWLKDTGAYYVDAHHTHIPTATGPGHASILSGSDPISNGIVGNDWYDRKSGKEMYCTDDPSVETVGGKSGPMSPKNMLSTTVGDELKMATNGKAKVVGVSFKDRAAILMAGHAADTVIWLDGGNGKWVSSSFYFPNKQLPKWVEDINRQDVIAKAKDKAWEPLLADKEYWPARRAPAEKAPANGKAFSHATNSIGNFTRSGQGQDYLFDTAKKAIANEQLGQDEIPDVIAINLATNDYVGHAYGPNSPEVMDISIRTDRLLSDLFNYLNKQVPGGIDNVLIALTGDHGVVPIPEESANVYKSGVKRGPATGENPKTTINAALTAKYGAGDWVLWSGEPNLYLNEELVTQKKLDIAEVEKTAADAVIKMESQYYAFTRTDIMAGRLPQWLWTPMVYNGFHPKICGNLLLIDNPGWYNGGGTGTGHGTPWQYDSHVPVVLRGPGITKGWYSRTVGVTDIAPTISQILGIEYPTGCVGHPLREAIDKK